MRKFVCVLLFFVAGCAGTGFEKRATLVPDSISIGYMQEQYKHDSNAWNGISISGTWEFK